MLVAAQGFQLILACVLYDYALLFGKCDDLIHPLRTFKHKDGVYRLFGFESLRDRIFTVYNFFV